MSDLSPETEKLLALARGAGTLTDARRAQIKAGLMAQIAAGGVVGGAVSHAFWGKAAWFSSPFVKGLSAIALLSAVGVGVYVGARPHIAAPMTLVGSDRNAAPHGAQVAATSATSERTADPGTSGEANGVTPSVAPAPNTSRSASAEFGATQSSGVEPSSLEPNGARPSSAQSVGGRASSSFVRGGASTPRALVAAGAPSSSAATSSSDTLAEETRLLRDADQALRAGNAARALLLLDEDASRFPHGMLGPERAAERMIARCQLGQIDGKSAQMYLASHASSPFAARVADACHVSR